MILSKSDVTPRIRQQPLEEAKLINKKKALIRGLLLNQAWFWPQEYDTEFPAQTVLILPSYELKSIGYRRIPIGRVSNPLSGMAKLGSPPATITGESA
jgi:hypothetical protein